MDKRLSSHKATMEIVKKHDFKFTKSLGQNFLIDDNIIDKIVDGSLAGQGDKVIEVGPGIGTLTRELASRSEKVMVVEIDKKLIPILGDTLSDFDNVTIVNEDIMKADIKDLIDKNLDGGPVKLVANLPYYITTPIIMRFLEEDINVTDIVVMVQKEVAERMNANPGKKDFSALSVAVQFYCDTEIVAKVPRHLFVPQPNVDSIVIALRVRPERKYKVEDEDLFFKIVKASFGQRRKTLLNSLTSMGILDKTDISAVLSVAGIDEKRRGETLSLEEFARLSDCMHSRIKELQKC
ncbi:MAG: 16S rRNA (adenine(1518)-N(6)/adenine(1519)-N(6))-dimethyltransferase RsmA [Peptostreptococcus anaerobius]|uniref:16S rRNA (adenine(1518)-N(6)/adenine(1519)-N(6))- dimethyltransferase RsmA n=1 Tax=Peptostreptococcus anaerobius TaxID=1261 RepID=UPI002901FA3D|nr:16S rRNA (adenine(1518)-N(6)/adenine(1519)-N(6))-dimethyltransferase RsmA [Peptostreptococcus anaerobius]MDU0963658.1 16S rRNA (adenine(1518)-N(6)/adenine(1519)-N(6))-dimethyltransferase RsmA [Peptostreptococcus anaerobius]MDU0997588.1 16S rRNA (adenine(1518)-N(6)/adenine(1519)-N(6))-dimethyltransferase RsmA [Peptostreptococcus anaerobius]